MEVGEGGLVQLLEAEGLVLAEQKGESADCLGEG